MEDLITIEKDGIEISPNTYVAFISTDNLGGHALGGLVENFSTTPYFSRYCLITRKKFCPQLVGRNETKNGEQAKESDNNLGTEADIESEADDKPEAD